MSSDDIAIRRDLNEIEDIFSSINILPFAKRLYESSKQTITTKQKKSISRKRKPDRSSSNNNNHNNDDNNDRQSSRQVQQRTSQVSSAEKENDDGHSSNNSSTTTTDMEVEEPTSPPSSPLLPSSPTTPPAPLSPASQRQRELDEVRGTCADWQIDIPIVEALHDIYCPRCTNRCIEKQKCPGCDESVCSYYCFDIDGGQDYCWKCKGYDLGKGERVVSQSQPKFTLADFEELVRVWREQFNCENCWAAITPALPLKSNMQKWTYREVRTIWSQGTSDVLECIDEDGRVVPLRDLVVDGHFTPNQVNTQHVSVTNAQPSVKVDRKIHTVDVRTSNLHHDLRHLYSEKGKSGNFVLASNLKLHNPSTSGQALQDQFTIKIRRVIVESWFMSLCKQALPLMELLVPDGYHGEIEIEDDEDELSNISFDIKRKSINNFLHEIVGVPDSIVLPPLIDSDKVVKNFSEEAVSSMRRVLNTNYGKNKTRITKALAEVVRARERLPEKSKQLLFDLERPKSTELLELIDAHRGGTLVASERTAAAFNKFKSKILKLIKELSKDLPHLKAIQKWEDISSMTPEQFQGPGVNEVMGTLICNFAKFVGKSCALCGAEILDLVNAALASVHTDHGKQEGKQTGELTGDPSTIAIRHGAIKFREAIEEHELRNMCSKCHCHSEQSNPFRGDDDVNKGVCFQPLPTPTMEDIMTPEEVLMGGEPLKSLEQWMSWSKEERVKFLKPIRFMFLIGVLISIDAFSEAEWVACRGDDIRCSVLFLLGVDADDYAPFHFGWFDASKGNTTDNCFHVTADRAEMTQRLLMNLIASVGCMRDPDPQLKDLFASICNLAASEHTSVHEDHYGGKNCCPSALSGKGLVYMLNEFASYLVPMKSETHKNRTANQTSHPDAARKKLEMIPRDYSKNTEMYSDARRAHLSSRYNNV